MHGRKSAPGKRPVAFEQRRTPRERRCSSVVGVLAGALVFSTATVFAQDQASGPERFEGRIANTGTFGNAGSNFFSIQVDEYTSDEEFIEFLEILAGGGPRRLEDAFLRSRKGRIVIDSLGYDIALARSAPTQSGRMVRVFTVRHLGFDESVGRSRSREYPFGMIELQLDHNGRGDGVLVGAARLRLSPDGRLEVETFRETFATPAFRLLNVETR
jgi:hypothetical protein